MPRKTHTHHSILDALDRPASMRPRPDATENLQFAHVVQHGLLASMRPRPDATENGFRRMERIEEMRLQ